MTSTADKKQAAIEQWSADPCGAELVTGEPGTAEHIENLMAMRNWYAGWMQEELGYAEASGLSVLDVGCGQGIDLARYALAEANVTGIDLTPRHVELATAHLAALGLDGQVVNGDAEALPFPEESFDRVSSNGVLHHTPDMAAALREVRRVLRPAGTATIIVYNKSSLHYWLHQFLVRGVLMGGLLREGRMSGVLSCEYTSIEARPLVRVYTRRQLERMMRDAGFIEVRVRPRHFGPSDTIPTNVLSRVYPRFRDPNFLDRIGRVAGWYLVADGRRPATKTPASG